MSPQGVARWRLTSQYDIWIPRDTGYMIFYFVLLIHVFYSTCIGPGSLQHLSSTVCRIQHRVSLCLCYIHDRSFQLPLGGSLALIKASTSSSSSKHAECSMPLRYVSIPYVRAAVCKDCSPVRLERHVVAHGLEQALRPLRQRVPDHLVPVAVGHEDGRPLVDVVLRDVLLERLVQEQPRRHADDAGNLEGAVRPAKMLMRRPGRSRRG